jgi:p-cumic alcohol dehydrogenase
MSLEKKIAVVTGAATGIGDALAKGLASAGAHVIGVDVTASDDQNFGVERVQCDLSDPASVERCFANIKDRHGGVDILVNNAALASEIKPQPFDQITPEDWTRVMTLNTIMRPCCTDHVSDVVVP